MSYRIALFLPSLIGGGAERVMVNLACGFTKLGFCVDIVLVKAQGTYLQDIPPEIRIVDLKAERTLYSLPKLVGYLLREKPEALLSALEQANVVALWAKKLAFSPVRVVVSVHSTLSVSSQKAFSWRGRLSPWWAHFFYPWAEAIVAVSQGVAEDLIACTGLPRREVHVIYNPIITPELFIKAEEPLDHPWFRLGEPPVVLGVGRLAEEKDFPTLIRAFALVKKERPVRLVILGEGEDRSKIESLVRKLGLEKEVALPGFVENPYKYMKRAAVFVLSSRWEGFGNVLVEAMTLGTPVVSTDCPSGPAEILEGGKWGRLVPVGDVGGLARAILGSFDKERNYSLEWAKAFSLERALEEYLRVLGLS